jgi:hypothetical protein
VYSIFYLHISLTTQFLCFLYAGSPHCTIVYLYIFPHCTIVYLYIFPHYTIVYLIFPPLYKCLIFLSLFFPTIHLSQFSFCIFSSLYKCFSFLSLYIPHYTIISVFYLHISPTIQFVCSFCNHYRWRN